MTLFGDQNWRQRGSIFPQGGQFPAGTSPHFGMPSQFSGGFREHLQNPQQQGPLGNLFQQLQPKTLANIGQTQRRFGLMGWTPGGRNPWTPWQPQQQPWQLPTTKTPTSTMPGGWTGYQ